MRYSIKIMASLLLNNNIEFQGSESNMTITTRFDRAESTDTFPVTTSVEFDSDPGRQ